MTWLVSMSHVKTYIHVDFWTIFYNYSVILNVQIQVLTDNATVDCGGVGYSPLLCNPLFLCLVTLNFHIHIHIHILSLNILVNLFLSLYFLISPTSENGDW